MTCKHDALWVMHAYHRR